MKRLDFLKEMGTSLLDTVKFVSEPLLFEKLEKVEGATDKVLGISWHPLQVEHKMQTELEVRFVQGKPIILFFDGANMQAFSGICPVCSNIIIVTTLYSSGKCLNCEKEFNFKTMTGELKINALPIKKKNQHYFIAFQRGEDYA